MCGRNFVGRCFVLVRGKTTNNNTITKPVERREKKKKKSKFKIFVPLDAVVDRTCCGEDGKRKKERKREEIGELKK